MVTGISTIGRRRHCTSAEDEPTSKKARTTAPTRNEILDGWGIKLSTPKPENTRTVANLVKVSESKAFESPVSRLRHLHPDSLYGKTDPSTAGDHSPSVAAFGNATLRTEWENAFNSKGCEDLRQRTIEEQLEKHGVPPITVIRGRFKEVEFGLNLDQHFVPTLQFTIDDFYNDPGGKSRNSAMGAAAHTMLTSLREMNNAGEKAGQDDQDRLLDNTASSYSRYKPASYAEQLMARDLLSGKAEKGDGGEAGRTAPSSEEGLSPCPIPEDPKVPEVQAGGVHLPRVNVYAGQRETAPQVAYHWVKEPVGEHRKIAVLQPMPDVARKAVLHHSKSGVAPLIGQLAINMWYREKRSEYENALREARREALREGLREALKNPSDEEQEKVLRNASDEVEKALKNRSDDLEEVLKNARNVLVKANYKPVRALKIDYKPSDTLTFLETLKARRDELSEETESGLRTPESTSSTETALSHPSIDELSGASSPAREDAEPGPMVKVEG